MSRFHCCRCPTRLAARLPQRSVVTVTTNVPGPRRPLYALGRRLVRIIPYVPIASTVHVGVSVLSYCDEVSFGITGDYDSSPDVAVLADSIKRRLAELVRLARGTKRPAGHAAGAAGLRTRSVQSGRHQLRDDVGHFQHQHMTGIGDQYTVDLPHCRLGPRDRHQPIRVRPR